MNNYKNQLIDKYILPFFSDDITEKDAFIEDLHKMYKLHQVIDRQVLNLSGSSDDGKMWFAITSTVHSYYLCQDKKKQRGRQIWKKQQFILDCDSLLEDTWRHDFIQALEPGEFLSIQFTDLKILMQKYPFIRPKIEHLRTLQQRYYSQHLKLLTESADDRLRLLHQNHPVFIACSTQEMQAMHVNMSVRSYRNHLRSLHK